MSEPKLVIGRIESMSDGTTYIRALDEPKSHVDVMFEHQKSVQRLVDAARAYSERPSMGTLNDLKQAAHRLK